jgi:hypothetical protein
MSLMTCLLITLFNIVGCIALPKVLSTILNPKIKTTSSVRENALAKPQKAIGVKPVVLSESPNLS